MNSLNLVRHACRLLLLVCAVYAAPAKAQVSVAPFPENFDLSSVERLYKSAKYSVEVKAAGAPDSAFMKSFVFETRNDWVLHDYFNSDPKKRGDVLLPANVVGNPTGLGTGKADLRTASFSQMFSKGPVDARVTLLRPGERVQAAVVRPLRFAIPHRISPDRRSISFRLDRPRKVSVEINGRLDPLFLFVDAPDVPDLKATYYFAPGLHRIPGNGTLTLKSNERVYIAAGAIVEGRFLLETGSTNINIRGRGLLSGGEWPELRVDPAWQARHAAIYTKGSSHFKLEGLTLVQSTTWQVAMDDFSERGDATHDNDYRNFKTISWNGCTDGIWITGNNNRADDIFIFNNDDFFVSKGGRNSRISNAVVWGGTWGRFFLFHNIFPNTPSVENLLVENIDILGREGGHVMFLFENYKAEARRPIKTTRNVTFRNITFEERRRPGNSNNTAYNAAEFIELDTSLVPGRISGLTFENVHLDQLLPREGAMLGTAPSPIVGVTFKNVTIKGKRVTSFGQLNIRTNVHVNDVRVVQRPTSEKPSDLGD